MDGSPAGAGVPAAAAAAGTLLCPGCLAARSCDAFWKQQVISESFGGANLAGSRAAGEPCSKSQGLSENPPARPKMWPRSRVCSPSFALAAHLPHELGGGSSPVSCLQAVLPKATLLHWHMALGRGWRWGGGRGSGTPDFSAVSKRLQPQLRVLCLPQGLVWLFQNALPRCFCSCTSWRSPAISAPATPALLPCRIIICSILLCFSVQFSLSIGEELSCSECAPHRAILEYLGFIMPRLEPVMLRVDSLAQPRLPAVAGHCQRRGGRQHGAPRCWKYL